ncbi:MAG TPA: hypothetical protein DDW90_08140 [Cyanobacteria bacterium UBA9971]|nr:hypothetical protein [Cyanobacteria bacterium UBA9971]HCR36152.1 hypothetical protein [Candidatus Woesebacteria bacterium]
MIKNIFKLLYNIFYIFATKNLAQNYYFFSAKLEEIFPKGLLLIHDGIEFYIKDYSSSPDFILRELEPEENKLYIITEYFDTEKKEFIEKYFHEDFFKNRYKVYLEASQGNK